MKITKKNYEDIFVALCKHFHVDGFCIRTPGILVGVVGDVGNFFYHDNAPYDAAAVKSSYLCELLERCPLVFKENASLSFKAIAYYCRKDVNDILFNFVKESMKTLCEIDIQFNGAIFKKISIEELFIENDLT